MCTVIFVERQKMLKKIIFQKVSFGGMSPFWLSDPPKPKYMLPSVCYDSQAHEADKNFIFQVRPRLPRGNTEKPGGNVLRSP